MGFVVYSHDGRRFSCGWGSLAMQPASQPECGVELRAGGVTVYVCGIFDIALTGAFSASGFNGLLRASAAAVAPHNSSSSSSTSLVVVQ